MSTRAKGRGGAGVRRGRPPIAGGAAALLLQVRMSERARKSALVDEADALGLSLSAYVERALFSMSPEERLRRAAAPPIEAATIDERIAGR